MILRYFNQIKDVVYYIERARTRMHRENTGIFMTTAEVSMDEMHIDMPAIEEAGRIIRSGGLVAFPTETVYGLGGDALNPQSSAKIYAAKGRPSDNPLIVHIACMEALQPIVQEIPETAEKLAQAFWPGPLTMIFLKKAIVPDETTGGLNTVAVRMPSHKVALALIQASGGYIAAPSANVSGRPSPTQAAHVVADMKGRIDMIIDGGSVDIGLESTIVDMTAEHPLILRPGYITKEMLSDILGCSVEYDRAILGVTSPEEHPRAPGMKYKHYAPAGDMVIVRGRAEAIIDYINRHTQEKQAQGSKVGVIATEETCGQYRADYVVNIGARADEEAIAAHLYAMLREFDEAGVTDIYSEEFDTPRIGQAIMNRLIRAAAHQIVEASSG